MVRALKRVKSIGWGLIVLMFWLYGGGRINAENYADSANRVASVVNPESRFDALLSELKDIVKRGGAKTQAEPEKGFQEIGKLIEFKQSLVAENEKVQKYFSQLESLIKEKKLPGEILNRHQEFVREYDAKYAALIENIRGIESAHDDTTGFLAKLTGKSGKADWDGVLSRASRFLEENTARPRQSHFDPKNLPHRSLKAEKLILPKLTREEWLRAFAKAPSQAGSTSSTKSQSSITVAATAQPTPTDLAETIEVKFTPEIRQLADSLGRNPVKIFNWVRNNIEFVPTWGSIQGAQLCLETRAGNAFDTASLLIALLRYSGIPARYQMGTIEVPIDKFMNWAGGFTNAEAAASLFASGGVPSVVRRVSQSGQVVTVKLEHVWAKAFVDYGPSGGAINSQGDTWVEMDPSFKQHTLSSPSQNLTSVVPFNRDAYLADSTDKSPAEFYQQVLANYVQQNHPGKVLDDFLYKKTIKASAPAVLGATLPYRFLVGGIGFSNIPDNLRQRVTVIAGHSQDASPLTYTASLPELLGKRLTLSFMPATPADVQVASGFYGLYRTPPYLMSVKPVLRVEGQEVAAGQPLGMCQPLQMTFLFDLPALGQRTVQNTITTCSYLTILVAPHLINEALGDKLAREFRRADDRFGTLNINNSDRDPSVGGILQVLGSYFFKRLDESIGTLKQFFPIGQLKTSFAAYVSSDVEASSLFGAPAALRFTAISIDADLLEDVALAKDGVSVHALSFEKLRGLESSYWEHGIFGPEEAAPNQPAVSTVRALQQAKRVGVTIHEINASNLAAIEPQLQVSPEVKEAIRDAVNAGLVVTTPTSGLELGSWQGVGYIVEDPLTGAGAYQISGGLSGGTEPIPLLQPHLTGGPPPSGQPVAIPRWPTAIIAVGWPVTGGSLDRGGSLDNMILRLYVNRWVVSDSIGFQIYSRGYNVYTADVDKDTFVDFVEQTGVKTDFDVFCYIGPTTLSGQIFLDDEQGNVRGFGPGSFSRYFWISYLSGNTGGICSSVNNLGIGCSPDPYGQQYDWWEALGYRPEAPFSGAVIGFWSLDYLRRSVDRAHSFWFQMASGSNAFDAAAVLPPTVYRLCQGSGSPSGCQNFLQGGR